MDSVVSGRMTMTSESRRTALPASRVDVVVTARASVALLVARKGAENELVCYAASGRRRIRDSEKAWNALECIPRLFFAH